MVTSGQFCTLAMFFRICTIIPSSNAMLLNWNIFDLDICWNQSCWWGVWSVKCTAVRLWLLLNCCSFDNSTGLKVSLDDVNVFRTPNWIILASTHNFKKIQFKHWNWCGAVILSFYKISILILQQVLYHCHCKSQQL